MTSGNTPQADQQTPETTSGNTTGQRGDELAVAEAGTAPRYSGPPITGETSATCPRCGSFAHFQQSGPRSAADYRTSVVVMMCAACQDGTIVIEEGAWLKSSYFNAEKPLLWWPLPEGGSTLAPDVGLPDEVVESYDEGVRCLSVRATHGAVCNFRTALAQIANDKGDDRVRKERHLANKLRLLRQSNPLLAAMEDYTGALLTVGNAAAHQDDYQPVSMEQATDAKSLALFLIYVLYEVPARARRMVPSRRT